MRKTLVLACVAVVVASVVLLLERQNPEAPRQVGSREVRAAPRDDSPEASNGGDGTKRSEAEHPALSSTCTVIGQAISTERSPVGGASVRLFVDGESVADTVTEHDGRFVATGALGEPSDARGTRRVVVSIAAPSGPCARRVVRSCAERIDVGRVLLIPSRTLTVTVVGEAGPVDGARVRIGLTDQFDGALQAESVTNTDGEVEIKNLPNTDLSVGAIAAGYALSTEAVSRLVNHVTVTLRPERIVIVSVADSVSNVPVAAAILAVDRIVSGPVTTYVPFWPFHEVRTTPDGEAVVRGVNRDTSLRVTMLEAAGYMNGASVTVGPGDTSARLELSRARVLRWRIESSGDAPVPANEAEITILARDGRPYQGSARAVIAGGEVVVSDIASTRFSAHVRADTSIARLVESSPSTAFYRGRFVKVEVVDGEGAPEPGIGIALRIVGAHAITGRIHTDENGVAILGPAYPFPRRRARPDDAEKFAQAYVECFPFAKSSDGKRVVKTIDLAAVSQLVRVSLRPEQSVRVQITLDGITRLPVDYSISGPGILTPPEREFPETGELVVRYRPLGLEQDTSLRVAAAGYRAATGTIVGSRAVVNLTRR